MPIYAMKFISGKYQGVEVSISDHCELIVGRANDLDLVLVEEMVSRKHAKLIANDDDISITDLGSTNGTFVNGEKVRRATLNLADRVLIGTSIIKIINASEMTKDVVDDKQAVREMMEGVAARSPGSSSMSGELDEVPLPDLLQLFGTNKKSGVLTITGAKRGKVYIKEGQIVYAVIGAEDSMPPMKAICRMVAWDKGTFRLEDYSGPETFEHTFKRSTEGILMEAMRQHDEMQRMLHEMPDNDAQLQLCVPMAPKLNELSKEELDTVQMTLNFGNLGQIIDKVGETDLEAVTSVRKLLKAGYIEVAE